jgi:hypothetical protein
LRISAEHFFNPFRHRRSAFHHSVFKSFFFICAFGARRNLLQDAPTNIANLAMFKNIKFTERASLEFNATLQNVFNHPNFQSIDPSIEDAGLIRSQQAPFVGFADPSVTNDVVGNALGNRIVRVGLTVQVLSSDELFSLPAGFVRRVFLCRDVCSHTEQHCCA